MGGGPLTTTSSVEAERLEAPVTWKTYLMCVFAAFGGIFFGYDSGYINGVLGMDFFIETFEGLVRSTYPPRSLTHILTSFIAGQSHHTFRSVRRAFFAQVSYCLDPLCRYILRCYHRR